MSLIKLQESSLPLPKEAPKKEEEKKDQLKRCNGNITDGNVQRYNGMDHGKVLSAHKGN